MTSQAEPSLSSTDLAQLRAFEVVARLLSFSRAAMHLGVTSSALSQTIGNLEKSLGIRLLNRTTRSVTLTLAGSHLLSRVHPALAELADAVALARHQRSQPAGIIRIQSFRVAVDQFITPMLASFHQAYPDIVLDVEIDDHVADFVADGFDAAIRVGEVIARDLVAVPLGPPLRQLAVASPAYIARRGAPMTPRDLATHACIGWRWPGKARPYRWEFERYGKALEVEVAGPFIANSRDLCVRAAAEGLGIAFAIEAVVEPYIAAGTLIPLLQSWSAPFPGFHLCFPAQRQMSPALRAFIDAIRAPASAG
ncbi:LysR family transcriptional regulator [Variovorax boronicumulans]|uniref:LysR family transcriptional regulator n=1 Tax=Variovorax boronicumulans TaxID=436515 RepID=UPI001C55C472